MEPTHQHHADEQYIICGGKSGRDRLEVLHRVLISTTLDFLKRAGVTRGHTGLDLGCGAGALTQDLARLVGNMGRVVGLDKDVENISHARRKAKSLGLRQLSYQATDIMQWEEKDNKYDFVYARFLLSHLSDPHKLLVKVNALLKTGGIILIEDVDFSGHFCFPLSQVFDRYVSLYTTAVMQTGADPNIGKRLPSLLQKARFRQVNTNLVQPVFQNGEGKQISSLTLENIVESLIRNKLVSRKEITTCLAKLREFEQNESTLISLPRIFQVWGQK